MSASAVWGCGAPQEKPLPPEAPLSTGVTRDALEQDGGPSDGAATRDGGGGYSGLGADSVTPDTLAKYAPKAPPTEVSQRIQRLLDLRGAPAGRLSPDHKTMYYTWNITGTPQVFRVDGPQHYPTQLTAGEDATRVSNLTPDGKWIIVARDRKGEENPGIYLLPAKGGALKLVSHKPKVQSRFEFASDDSRYVYFTTNERKANSYALYKFEIESGVVETVFSEDGLWSVSDYDGDRLLLRKDIGEVSAEFYEYDLAKKTLTPVLGQGESEELTAFYSGTPGELIITARKNPDYSAGEFRRAYRFAISDKIAKEKKLTPLGPDLKMDAWAGSDREKKHVFVDYNDGGYERARIFDEKTWKEIALPQIPNADSVSAGTLSRDGRSVTLSADSATSPMRRFVFDFDDKKLTEWLLPSTPEVDTSTFAKPALEYATAKDNAKIPMFVWRPKKCDKPCPVVVNFHGGPESQAMPGFNVAAQLFVDAGFVYVTPNVRGSDGYGRTYLHADDGPKRLDVITDIQDVSTFIRKNWAENGVAPKVGVMGGSYGGYATLVAMTMFAGAYDAGVSNVGISNLVTFLNNTAPYRRQLRVSEYGDPEKDRDALVKLSPVTYVSKVNAPLMIIAGASDPRVPVGEAIQMHDALTARKIDTKLIVFSDEGHGTQKRDNRAIEVGSTLDFFEVHLKGKSPAL